MLAFLLICGCSTGPVRPAGEQTPETEEAVLQTSEDTVTLRMQPQAEAVTVEVEAYTPEPTEMPTEEPTEEPTAEPVETPSPEPTFTPEPNPFLGTWSIESLPFLLDVRSDGTYSVVSNGVELTGTYTYTKSELKLNLENSETGETVDFKYYINTDKIMHDSYVLMRSEIEASPITEKVPVTFTNENDMMFVSVRGAIVDAVLKDERIAQEYCFTRQGLVPPENSRDWFNVTDSGEPSAHIRAFKYDGSYTLWVRDVEGTVLDPIDVNVESGFRYPIRATNVEPVRHSVKLILEENNSTVLELDEAISTEVAAAGIYTREGVVTAGVSLISHMSQYGYSIVYQGKGSYQGEKEWGVNPKWGSKLSAPTSDPNGTYYYVGMQCVASIVWAYKQAGMNLVSTNGPEIGKQGERAKAKDNRIDYDRAKSGDIVQTGGHYLMIIDRLDQNGDGAADAYLTYEMWAPHLTMLVLTFRQVRSRTFFSMDAFFDGTGHNLKKAVFWDDTFRIPRESFPDYLNEAIEYEETAEAFKAFLAKFGF